VAGGLAGRAMADHSRVACAGRAPGSASSGRWRDAELPADRSDEAGPELAVARDRRSLAGWACPLGVSPALVDETAAVLTQVPLEIDAFHDAI